MDPEIEEQELEEVDQVEDVEPEAAVDPNAPPPPPVVIDPAEHKRAQKDLAAARRQAKESDETARYWAEQARNTPVRQPAPEPEKEDDFSDVDLVDLITTQGAKGLATVIERMGYAKKADVQAEIVATRSGIAAENALMSQYPELADDQSPFFLATAKIYNQLKADPAMANSPNLINYAARTAKAELALRNDGGRGGRRAAPPAEEDDFEEELTPEEQRAARAGRQNGDRGRRDSRGAGPQGDVLSPMQADIVRKFQSVGAPLTEESYRRHAKAGVRMGGVPTRGRAA